MWNYPSARCTSNQFYVNARASSVTCEEEDSAAGGAYTNTHRHGSTSAEEEVGAATEGWIDTQQTATSSSLLATVGFQKPTVYPHLTIQPSSALLPPTPPTEVEIVDKEEVDLSFTYTNMFEFRGIDGDKFQKQQRAINRLRTTAPLSPSLSKDKSYHLAVIGAEMWQRMVVSIMQVDQSLARSNLCGAVQQPFLITSPVEWNHFLSSERETLIAENEAESQGDDGVGPMQLRGRGSTAQPPKKKAPSHTSGKFDGTPDTGMFQNFSSSQGNSLFSVCFRAFGATLHGFSELLLPFIACAYLDRLVTNHHSCQSTKSNVVFPSQEQRFLTPTTKNSSAVPAPRVFADQILRLAVVLLSLSAKIHTDLYVSLSYFCKYVKGVGTSYTPSELAQSELRVLRGLGYNCSVTPTHLKDLIVTYLTDDERSYVSDALSWKV